MHAARAGMARLAFASARPSHAHRVLAAAVCGKQRPVVISSAPERTTQISQIQRSFSTTRPALADKIEVTFIERDGTKKTIRADEGQSVLDCAHEHDIDLEGACEGTLACSTCHVVIEDDDFFKKIPAPDEEELDMLDLAIGLEDNSRLGCQVILKKELNGMVMRLPSDTTDMRRNR